MGSLRSVLHYDRDRQERTAILIADRTRDAQRGTAVLREQGVAVVRTLDFAGAAALPDAMPDADLLFVEAGGDAGTGYEAVLDRVDHLARRGRAAAIVAIMPELIDRTAARLASDAVAILCNPGAADTAATIRLALVPKADRVRQDGPGDAERLRGLGDELERIARMLVGMADAGGALPAAVPPPVEGTATVTAADYRRMLRDRRLRDAYLGDGLFADPAWDMLLDLAAARLEGSPVAVSSLCIAAAVPPTTALRWIRALTERGVMVRTPDPQDGRRIFIALAPATADAMAAYVRATKADPRA